ncbi:MAG: hypothetical protein ACFFD2_16270 [Promethearchaeota archaeon]
MSVILEQEMLYGSYITGNKVVLEPASNTGQTLPFLHSQIIKPELFKTGILQLNQILMAHPGVKLGFIYDPIVTVTENYVDFDGFARFGHSYSKIRFPEKLFKGGIKHEGSTNVDFNPRFIRNLRNRRYTQNLWLYIDPDRVELTDDRNSYQLKKIKMPSWWKDAYRKLRSYVNIEMLELEVQGKNQEEYNKVILSGKAFQQLVHEVGNSYIIRRKGVRSLLWNDKNVELMFSDRSTNEVKSIASVNIITPCSKSVRLWGVWRINNLSNIANDIIQADVYLARKKPSFWILHARSGVQLLIGYTPFTSALWTKKARTAVDKLIKNPYSNNIVSRQRRRKRLYKSKNKPSSRKNFVEEYPGQRKISDYILN